MLEEVGTAKCGERIAAEHGSSGRARAVACGMRRWLGRQLGGHAGGGNRPGECGDRRDLRSRHGGCVQSIAEPDRHARGDIREGEPERKGPAARVVALEGLDRHRIELRARLLGEDVDRLLVGVGRSIGPRRADRIEGVGHRDDARAERDLIAREALGIAGSVEPLVMVEHHRRELGVAELRDELRSVHGVPLDHLELGVRQPPGLVEHGDRRTDLADVVKGGGCTHLRDLLAGQSHSLGDRGRMASHSPRMPMGVRIAGLERGGKTSQELCSTLLAELLRGPQALEQAMGVGQLPLYPPAAQPSPDHELREEQVLPGVRARPPDPASDPGGAAREHDHHADRQQRRAKDSHGLEPPNECDGEDCDEGRRYRDLGQERGEVSRRIARGKPLVGLGLADRQVLELRPHGRVHDGTAELRLEVKCLSRAAQGIPFPFTVSRPATELSQTVGDLRPLALRPRLATGLPLTVWFGCPGINRTSTAVRRALLDGCRTAAAGAAATSASRPRSAGT